MGRSFLAGILSGSVVGALALGIISLIAPMPGDGVVEASAPPAAEPAAGSPPEAAPAAPAVLAEPQTTAEPAPAAPAAPEVMAEAGAPRPETPVVEVPAGSEFAKPKTEEEAVLPKADAAPGGAEAPAVIAPEAEPAPKLAEATPAARPEDAGTVAPAAPAAPEAGASEPATMPGAEVAGTVPPAAPALPTGEAPAALPSEPAGAAPVPPAPSAGTAKIAAAEPEPVPPAAPASEAAVQPEIATPPAPAPAPEKADGPPPQIVTDAPLPPVGVASAPKPGFRQAVPGVKVNRLPTIGGAPAPDAGAPAAPADAAPIELTPLVRYAAPYDNPGNRPLLSIVLLDIGVAAGGLDAATLGTISFPVTIAVDPTRKDAALAARKYRDEGLEVAILAPDLPAGASASDVEVAYQAYISALPETVALIAAPDGRLQSDRLLAQHITALLKADGRGLMTYDKGLNPARQAADGLGVPNVAAFRTLDDEGENAATIGRYLDRAAFEAEQKGRIVVVARSYPETVTALFAWAAKRDGRVALAPVSAALIAPAQ